MIQEKFERTEVSRRVAGAVITLFALMLNLGIMPDAKAAAAPTLSVDSMTVNVGDIASVPIRVYAMTNVTAMTLDASYDDTKLSFQSIDVFGID